MAEPGHLKRRLLGLSNSAEEGVELLPGDDVTLLFVLSCAVSILLVLVLIICACIKTKNPQYPLDNFREAKKNGVALVQVTPKPDRRSATSAEGAEKVDCDVVTVQENGTTSHDGDLSPGQPISEQDAKSSAEKRALPQIPHTAPPDDYDEDDNYDIIPVSRSAAAATPKSPPPAAISPEQSSAGDNNSDLYSEVTHNEPDGLEKGKKQSDPPYSKIKSEKADPPYAKVKSPTASNSNPYVQVDCVGDPSYAQVSDRPNSSSLPGVSGAEAGAAPPIPDKRFSGEEDEMAGHVVSGVKPASPDLPPRNLFGVADTSAGLLAAAAEGVSPTAGGAQNAALVMPAQPAAKREPPYSEVTARESIASIRHREEAERALRLANPDVLYESVNYEQITNFRGDMEPPNRELTEQDGGQMETISSDLYAEITTASGGNSNRSPTYAHVPDLRDAHAPTPPPVESLKHLSQHGYAFDPEDSIVDPGYSKINKRTTIHRTTLTDTAPTSEELDQMYAVVDKSHKRSQSDGGAGKLVSDNDISHLYAQVDKSIKKSPSPAAAPRVPSHHEYEGTGAIPKIRTNAHFLVGTRNSKDGDKKRKKSSSSEYTDPSYDTVKDIHENYQTINNEPGYESVRERGLVIARDNNGNPHNSDRVSEFDPNYEQVNLDDIIQNLPGGNTNQTFQARPVVQSSEDPWLKREPLYQEIDENAQQREEKFKKRKNQSGTML